MDNLIPSSVQQNIAMLFALAIIVPGGFVTAAVATEKDGPEDESRAREFLVSPIPAATDDYASQILKRIKMHCRLGLVPRLGSAHGYSVNAGPTLPARVQFRIGEDGHLSKLRLLKSSGHVPFDNEAVIAIKKSAPFPRPGAYPGSEVLGENGTIEIAFDDTNDWDTDSFMSQLRRRIKAHWNSPINNAGIAVLVSFTIKVNGDISGLRLLKSCGDKAIDANALDAVRQAAPFPHLPNAVKAPVKIEFNFANVFR